MSNLHAMFSVGAMAGAASTGALLRAGVDPRVQLATIGIATVVVVTQAARWMLEAHPAPAGDEPQEHFLAAQHAPRDRAASVATRCAPATVSAICCVQAPGCRPW
jgi:hypothetical protein